MTIRNTDTFTKVEGGCTLELEAYTDDGGKTWRWPASGEAIPLATCRDYGIPCDPDAQAGACDPVRGQDNILE